MRSGHWFVHTDELENKQGENIVLISRFNKLKNIHYTPYDGETVCMRGAEMEFFLRTQLGDKWYEENN